MPYKLLLADDSVTIQRVIELTFADEDVKVTAVGDGQQAIDRIATDRPDIVLADVGMPGQDGYAVASFIKSDPSLASIPVLLLTGAFEPVDEARAREAGCDGVLAKPFEPQLLIGKVRELLGGRARADAGSAALPETLEPPVPGEGNAAWAVPSTPGIEIDEDATVKMVRPPLTPPDGDPGLEVDALDLRPDPPGAADGGTLDDYFDRLDAAFAHLTGGQQGRDVPSVRPPADPWTAAVKSPSVWPGTSNGSGGFGGDDVELMRRSDTTSPADDLEAAASAAAPAAVTAVPVPDAFAALLAAEREHGPEAVHLDTAPGVPMVLLPGTAVSASFVDDVARRVIERLGEPAFREAVKDVVSEIAERLIREEIARIKATVR